MKKILIFLGSTDVGGTEKQLLNILSIIQSSFEVSLVVFYRNGDLENKFRKLNLEYIDLTEIGENKNRILKLFYKFFSFWKVVKKEKPEIIHFFLPHSYFLGGWLSFFFDCKFIMSRRSLNFYQKKYFFTKYIEILLHKKMDLIIGNSKKVIENLVDDEFVPKNKLKLIYNGVHKNNKKKKYGKKVNLICVANFLPYKNHLMLIKACNLINFKENWNLRLIGNGPKQDLSKIKKLIKKFRLDKNIKIIENQVSIDKFLINSDIGILTSDEEGFSNSILEYMSFGLCVVATKVGGNEEAIINNDCGYLVGQNDHIALAEKLNFLINNKRIRRRMANSALKRSLKEFDMENSALKFSSVYNKLLRKS